MIDLEREEIIGIKDVAKLLKVTPKAVYAWARRTTGKRLETVKFGGKVVTSREAVKRFGDQREEPMQQAAITQSQAAYRSQYENDMRLLRELHGIK